jgi:hypothetical protein
MICRLRGIIAAMTVVLGTAACHHSVPRASTDALEDSTTKRCGPRKGPWLTVMMQWGASDSLHRWSNDSLRTVLLAMSDTDQAVRNAWIAHQSDSALIRHMRIVDSTNDQRIRRIIQQSGWPTRSMVGPRGESAAWLIIQHGDDSLQHAGLRLLQQAGDSEVNPTEVAMLDDRVRMHDKLPQRFGSQLSGRPDGSFELYTLEDPAHVGERRAKAGMEPLPQYLCEIEALYHHPVVGGVPSS